MNEFVNDDFKIYCVLEDESIKEYTINDLLPYSFSL